MCDAAVREPADHDQPPSWQQFHKGYAERFVLDCVIRLESNGAEVRVAQAPSAKRPGARQQAAAAKQQQQQQQPQPGRQQQRQHAARGRRGAAAAGRGGGAEPKGAAAAAARPGLDRESDPALTGTTVWDGAIVLGQYLTSPASPLRRAGPWPSGRAAPVVLELGAGTGAVSLCLLAGGVAAGAVLTDIPDMLPHLNQNVAHNSRAVNPAAALVAPLSWGDAGDAEAVARLAQRRWPLPRGAAGERSGIATTSGGGGTGGTAGSGGGGGGGGGGPPLPPWDAIVGSDLIYYSYSEATPHSRLLLSALRQLAAPATLIVLSLSLHHNPEEVARFLAWAGEAGFEVEVVPPQDVPAAYRVPDVQLAKLRLRGEGDGSGGGPPL
ncbi:hypothetical protein Rsub_11654 [Raphidocelis subcapitata]|uniref:Uncharacterized protein n=1 Tax=Raphidocelis subcapitata TaxID=307507 RepID=A0A2V0PLC8_9CHLO|nr:hypothetical protein Rsub_11654 [Raphidocelis subcapitata]|eukprot:GBF98660.1 hypothetical protein Rsub_11654 [Raphidocelis subcapitata]